MGNQVISVTSRRRKRPPGRSPHD